MDTSIIIDIVATTLTVITVIIDLIRLCFYILFEISKKEK